MSSYDRFLDNSANNGQVNRLYRAQLYSIESVSSKNTLIVTVDELFNIFQYQKMDALKTRPVGLQDCKMCLIHGITYNVQEFLPKVDGAVGDTVESKESHPCCVESFKYKNSFGVKVLDKSYIFPMPSVYSSKNFSFFRSIIESSFAIQESYNKEEEVPDKVKVPANVASSRLLLKTFLHKYLKKSHKKFLQNDFMCGNFLILQSGKRSYVRSYLLGHRHNGARMTMVVDNTLGPNQISIPEKIYFKLPIATNLVIINRDPSINDTCIYVCEMSTHNTDACIHLNSFVLDGLHADQDGDDISINYLKYELTVPRPLMKTSITELRQLSWNHGYRHNIFYKPRYYMGQQFRHLLYAKDAWFQEHSAFYKCLSNVYGKHTVRKIDAIMDLGSSIMHSEVNDFIELILAFNEKYVDNLLRLEDYVKCNDEMKEVVNSKSKGSDRHLELYRTNMSKSIECKDLKIAFDDKIDSCKVLEREGQTQFSLLHALSPAAIMMGALYMGERIVIEKYTDADLMDTNKYNTEAVYYISKLIADNGTLHNSINGEDTKETEEYESFTHRFLDALKVLEKSQSKSKLTREQLFLLFTSRNPYMSGVDKIPLGLHYSIKIQSQKIQTALNVKRLKEVSEKVSYDKGTMHPIIPSCCIKWLYAPKEMQWFRVTLSDKNLAEKVHRELESLGYAILYENIVEYYFKVGGTAVLIQQLSKIIACDSIQCIIFASNCHGMRELFNRKKISPQHFMDNLTSFLYCYYTNSLCVDHGKPEYINMYNFVSVMFLINKNLNNPTNSDTIPPLHATSGEFPQRVLANIIKRKRKSLYPISTNREKRMFDKLCDVHAGTSSEVVVELLDKRRRLNSAGSAFSSNSAFSTNAGNSALSNCGTSAGVCTSTVTSNGLDSSGHGHVDGIGNGNDIVYDEESGIGSN